MASDAVTAAAGYVSFGPPPNVSEELGYAASFKAMTIRIFPVIASRIWLPGASFGVEADQTAMLI